MSPGDQLRSEMLLQRVFQVLLWCSELLGVAPDVDLLRGVTSGEPRLTCHHHAGYEH